MGYIDDNDNPVMLAYNETTGKPESVRVDPTLGYLEVYAIAPDANTPTTINNAGIDANDNQTLLLYNETSGLVEPARCGSNGELLVIAVS